MDLYEYQARDLFESYGVPVLAGIIADTPAEARAAAEKLGGVVVVEAGVKVTRMTNLDRPRTDHFFRRKACTGA